ncbi:MAG: hypothetical protein IJU54_01145 [Alphaproteobacteria bacterium]|nr:hypothetical protein [Alphaproteobacteria bacterium]
MTKKNILKSIIYVTLIGVLSDFQDISAMELSLALLLEDTGKIENTYYLQCALDVSNYDNIIPFNAVQEYTNSIHNVLQTKRNGSFNKDTAKKLYNDLSSKVQLMQQVCPNIQSAIRKYEKNKDEIISEINYNKIQVESIQNQIDILKQQQKERKTRISQLNKLYTNKYAPLNNNVIEDKNYLLNCNTLYKKYCELKKIVKNIPQKNKIGTKDK